MTTGADVIAESIKKLGVKVVFGLVGIPVIEVADALVDRGVRFIGFRNEQAASYAASAYGYLTQSPGVLLVVGGPGIVHALAGIENAKTNKWPLLVLAGSSESELVGRGAFQELDQISTVKPFTKSALKCTKVSIVPEVILQSYIVAGYGSPGAVYVDLPAEVIKSTDADEFLPTAERFTDKLDTTTDYAISRSKISEIASAITAAKFPLLVIGKGAAYGRAEESLRALVKNTNVAFLPTPMGKGVIPDSWDTNVSAARSAALAEADVVVVFGARLNWILHFGSSSKWKMSPTFYLVDIDRDIASELAVKVVPVVNDAGTVAEQLLTALGSWRAPQLPEKISESKSRNSQKAALKSTKTIPEGQPLTYERVYALIKDEIKDRKDMVFVSEGANTMDIARSAFDVDEPRRRIDAGTNATMGVGMGYAIAAAAVPPELVKAEKPLLPLVLEGDSAFGFSAMELETASRYGLGMVVVVMNNNGVYHGQAGGAEAYKDRGRKLRPTTLGFETRYDLIADAVGGTGFFVKTEADVGKAIKEAISKAEQGKVSLLNVLIETGAEKELTFGWMASTKK
ncbi:hypothetical protein CANCADRAFT_27702 [Tortispora caseinolytica NRRL Y-17796]|uniref:2-hydroxyacyl-CoA lyase n=1 Tax=Tortispora caseinolytica NRRL Y-17796 TaxID=767744 RepID=A0A1E4TBX7_9ASCO|nr:hypothetical protein CANCADRAFT_27702 [Tortispora caseinolytica NRRL Y-17796]